MLFYGVIVIALTFAGYGLCDDCLYIDSLGKRHYHTCDSGCCGDIHHVDCCNHKYLSAIVLGSIVGFFLLVVAIVVTIHCCYRRQVKVRYLSVTRNYGTISAPDRDRLREDSDSSVRDNVVIVPEVDISVTPATPDVPDDTMGNENKPAGRVDDDVQPYYPDVRPYPDNQPYVPDTAPYNPAGRVDTDVQPYYPDDQPYRPDNQPYVPDNQPYRPDNQPYVPDNQPYYPDNQPYRPDNQPYRPDNQPYVPDNQPYRPDSQPYQPDVQPYTPDVQPFTPAGMVDDDVGPYQPDTEPYIPDDTPYGGGGDDQPY